MQTAYKGLECGRLRWPLAALAGLPLRNLGFVMAARGVSSSEEADIASSAADGEESKEQPDFVAELTAHHLLADGSASLARKSQENPVCTPIVYKCCKISLVPLGRRTNRPWAPFWNRCLAPSGGARSKVAGDIHGNASQV